VSAVDPKSKANDEGTEGGYFFGFTLRELRGKMEDACIGYLSMNVVNPPEGAFWGKFNNRALDQNWIKSLANTFKVNLDNCTAKTAMDIAIDPDWLVDKSTIEPKVEGKDINDVKEINFSQEGWRAIKNNNLWVLSGNHRHIALTAFRDSMKEEVAIINQAIETAMSQVSEEQAQNMDSVTQKDLEITKREAEFLEEKIHNSTKWLVRVYDRGESRARPSKSAPMTAIRPLQPK
jgi:hypothetical protein